MIDLSYSDFSFIQPLSGGSMGVVNLFKYDGDNTNNLIHDKLYILKENNIHKLDVLTTVINNIEYSTMTKIMANRGGHDNIVKYYGMFKYDNKKVFILEYILGESLNNYGPKNPLSMDEIKKILKQLVNALIFLKESNIIHRDLKLDNVMYHKESCMVKVIDFGVAKLNNNRRLNNKFKNTLGPNKSTPLEFINSKNEPSSKSDIWSLGILLYTLVSGNYPINNIRAYSKKSDKLTTNMNIKIKELSNRDPLIKELINKMLKVNQANRIEVNDLLNSLKHFPDPETGLYNSAVETYKPDVSILDEYITYFKYKSFINKKQYEKFIDTKIKDSSFIGSIRYPECVNCKVMDGAGLGNIYKLICYRCGINVCDNHSQKVSLKLFKKHISSGHRRMKDHHKNDSTKKIKTSILGYVVYDNPGVRVFTDNIRVCNLCALYAQKKPNNEFDNLLGGKKKNSVKKKTYRKIIAGRKRVIHTGPKGGKYFIRSKKKVYIK